MILQPNEDLSSVGPPLPCLEPGPLILFIFHEISETLKETFLSSQTDCFMSRLKFKYLYFYVLPFDPNSQEQGDLKEPSLRHKNLNSFLILNPLSQTQRNEQGLLTQSLVLI